MRISTLEKALATIVLLTLVVGLGVSQLSTRPAMAASNYLHTSGNKIYDASNQAANLSGLNWFGFETSNNVVHGLWSRSWQSMLDQIKSLGYNVIRLPFSNAMLQAGVMPTSVDYTINPDLANLTSLQVMDKIIAGAGQRGIKVILDNHRSTPGGGPESGGLWYTGGYPESGWIADWQMIELARMPRLQRLNLSHTRISDDGMLYLKNAPAIQDLNLYYAEQITDQGLSAIRNWKQLKRLNLRGTRISDGAMEIVSGLTQVEALDIANTPVTDNGLDHLITLTSLKELVLGHRRETGNEVELLRLLPTLTYLDLGGAFGNERPDITQSAAGRSGAMGEDLVSAIAELKAVRVLRLGHSNISGEALRKLAALGQVERLGLEGCSRIDDNGARELVSWKSLKSVDLQETAVTGAGIAALRKARPGLAVLSSGAGPAAAAEADQ